MGMLRSSLPNLVLVVILVDILVVFGSLGSRKKFENRDRFYWFFKIELEAYKKKWPII